MFKQRASPSPSEGTSLAGRGGIQSPRQFQSWPSRQCSSHSLRAVLVLTGELQVQLKHTHLGTGTLGPKPMDGALTVSQLGRTVLPRERAAEERTVQNSVLRNSNITG